MSLQPCTSDPQTSQHRPIHFFAGNYLAGWFQTISSLPSRVNPPISVSTCHAAIPPPSHPQYAPSCQSEGLMLKRVPVLKVGVINSFRYSGLRGTGQDLGPNDIPNGRPTALTGLIWSHRTTWNYPAGLKLKKTGRDPTSFRFWPTIHWPRMIDMMHDLWFTEDGTMSSCSLGWSSW